MQVAYVDAENKNSPGLMEFTVLLFAMLVN